MDYFNYWCQYAFIYKCLGLLTIFQGSCFISIVLAVRMCLISHSDGMTPAGQPYVLASLPTFAANILQLLQLRAIQVFWSIKELKVMMKDKVATTEGEVMGGSDQGESGDKHKIARM
jgi:hypothetical protein